MRRLVVGLAAVPAIALLAGCPKPQPTPAPGSVGPVAAEEITLTVWDWHAADPSKGVGLWLAEIDREFEQLHPNITINHAAQSHTEYYEIFKAAAAAASPERGPDVVMLHQGSRILDNTESLVPLGEFMTEEFRANIVGWELTCEGYDAAGTPWAVPVAVQGLVWYYNKAVLTEAGLDPEKPPSTWDELLAACAAVKRVGKAGIACGEKEGFWADWFVNSAYFQTMTPEDKAALSSGELRWTDEKLVAILERLEELGDKGCFQEGAMSTPLFPDAGEVFMRGEAAFLLGLISDVAHWREFGEMMGPESIGVMTCPVFEEGPDSDKFPTGGAFAYSVTHWSPHPNEAYDYIAFVAGPEHATSFLTEVGSFPANQSYDPDLITDSTARTIADWMAEGRTGPQMTDMTPTAVGEELRRQCQRILTDQTDVRGALEAVEAAAQRVREERGE